LKKKEELSSGIDYQQIMRRVRNSRLPREVKRTVEILLEKKALRITVLRIKEHSDLTDYLIISIGTGPKHNQALADEIENRLRTECKLRLFGSEGRDYGEWILLDYVDFVVHIFNQELFQKYQLEKLWMDVKRYEFLSD